MLMSSYGGEIKEDGRTWRNALEDENAVRDCILWHYEIRKGFHMFTGFCYIRSMAWEGIQEHSTVASIGI